MADIFLSYEKRDRDLAARIAKTLRSEGLSVWWDDEMTPRENWDRTIEREIAAAGHVLVLWTLNSIDSEWVRLEATEAHRCEPSKLLQVRFENAKIPMAFLMVPYIELARKRYERSPGWNKLLRWIRLEIHDTRSEEEPNRSLGASDERRQTLVRDVFEDVYGVRHLPSYVKAVVDAGLRTTLVRDMMDIAHTVRELTNAELDILAVSDGRRFVLLETVVAFRFRNLSAAEQMVPVRYSLPLRSGAGARALAGVKAVKIGGSNLSSAEISVGCLASGGGADERDYEWPRTITSQGTLDVAILANTLKERSDSQTTGFYVPATEGLRVRASVLPGMRCGLRALTTTPLQLDGEGENWKCWSGDGPVLRNESVVFWWRIAEDDA